jgi:Tfp pilus assembly protein PilF
MRYSYVHAIALNDSGDRAGALAVLQAALQRFPNSPELLATLRDYSRAAGDAEAARRYSARLDRLMAPG